MTRRRPRLVPWLAVAAATALAISAAVVGGSTATRVVRTVASTESSATVVLEVPSVPTTLNPHVTLGDTPTTRAVASVIWPQAYLVGPGLAVTPDTDVVASAEVVGLSPQTVVYHLDPKAVWSDGQPIDASDFVYLWHQEVRQATASGDSASTMAVEDGYLDIASVTGSDGGETVTVVFRTPYADWTDLFDGLVPPQVGRSYGWSSGFDAAHLADQVWGGPWEVTSWTPGRQMELSPNPTWWGPRPAVAHIVLRAPGTTAAAVTDLADGSAQAMATSSFGLRTLDAVSSLPGVRSTEIDGSAMVQLVFNTRLAPLDLATVRQGIGHLVDRPAIVHDLVVPADPGAQTLGSFFAPAGASGPADDGAAYLRPDVAAAERLLAAGGVVRAADGTEQLAGQPFTLTLTWAAGDPWTSAVAPAVAADLEAEGIGVRTDPVPGTDLTARLGDTGWELALVRVAGQAWLSRLADEYSTNAPLQGHDGLRDLSGFDSATIDQLFTQAVGQLNVTQADDLYHQIDQRLWVDMPALPLFTVPEVVAWNARLVGLTPDPGGAGLLWQATTMAMTRPVTGGAPTEAAGAVPPEGRRTRTTRGGVQGAAR